MLLFLISANDCVFAYGNKIYILGCILFNALWASIILIIGSTKIRSTKICNSLHHTQFINLLMSA